MVAGLPSATRAASSSFSRPWRPSALPFLLSSPNGSRDCTATIGTICSIPAELGSGAAEAVRIALASSVLGCQADGPPVTNCQPMRPMPTARAIASSETTSGGERQRGADGSRGRLMVADHAEGGDERGDIRQVGRAAWPRGIVHGPGDEVVDRPRDARDDL